MSASRAAASAGSVIGHRLELVLGAAVGQDTDQPADHRFGLVREGVVLGVDPILAELRVACVLGVHGGAGWCECAGVGQRVVDCQSFTLRVPEGAVGDMR